jgi:hypothetical protein
MSLMGLSYALFLAVESTARWFTSIWCASGKRTWPRRTGIRRELKEKPMIRFLSLTASLALFSLLVVGAHSRKPQTQTPPQYPILDMVANKVIQKYQSSTCEQLWVKKSQKKAPTAEEKRVIQILQSDPQMRAAFINKVAAPIANKMFECGLIP